MTTSKRIVVRFVAIGVALLASGAVRAADITIRNTDKAAPGAVEASWSPEDLKRAVDITLLPARPFAAQEVMNETDVQSGAGGGGGATGKRPRANMKPDRTAVLFKADAPARSSAAAGGATINPEAVGTFGAYFTSSRVFPSVTVYPYSTIGRLYFKDAVGNGFACSASVVKPRLIVTAGHCIHNGNGAFYRDWLFVPATYDDAYGYVYAPYGQWSWRSATVTSTWAYGGGGVPNAADYGLIELNDQYFGVTLRRIGDVTGWLGWQTYRLLPNHAHLIGYPVNFDSGRKMHQVSAQSFRAVSPNCVEYGSDMTNGSSGGPWIQNLGQLAVGQPDTGLNRIVGVTSYGYTSPDPKVQGASIFDDRFSTLLTGACNWRVGNC